MPTKKKTNAPPKRKKKAKAPYKFTPARRKQFLTLLEQTGNVLRSATVVKMDKGYLYRLKDKDNVFSKEWEEAVTIGRESYIDEAIRRGVEGVEEPIIHNGKVLETKVKRFDSKLLTKLLEAYHPNFRPVRVLEGGDKPIRVGGISPAMQKKLDEVLGEADTKTS